MKKKLLTLLLVPGILSGCYQTVEYDFLHNHVSDSFLSRYQLSDSPSVPRVGNKIITVRFKDIGSLVHLGIRIYSEEKGDSLFITRAKIIGTNYEEEFKYNERVFIEEEVAVYEDAAWDSAKKIALPLYKGFIGTSNLNEAELFKVADDGSMEIEVFYLNESTGEEKSVVFDIVKEHYKSWVPPT